MTSGKQLCFLQGHKGRGVWRCLLHPSQDLLITAGADSSIKLWRLADWLPAHHPLAAQVSDAFLLPPLPAPPTAVAGVMHRVSGPEVTAETNANIADFALPASISPGAAATPFTAAADRQKPDAKNLKAVTATTATAEGLPANTEPEPEQRRPATPDKLKPGKSGRDSKGEWVRCMRLANQNTLYLATNQGCLYSIKLPSDSAQPYSTWQLLYSSPCKAAVICLQIIHSGNQSLQPATAPVHHTQEAGAQTVEAESDSECHWVVLGHITGTVTCLKVIPECANNTKQTCDANASTPGAPHSHLPPSLTPTMPHEDVALTGSHASHASDSSEGPQSLADSQADVQQPCAGCHPSNYITWDAHNGKPVLAVFIVPAFGPCHVFTTSVTGTAMRWWLMPETLFSSSPSFPSSSSSSSPALPGQVAAAQGARLLAEIRVPIGRGSQIVALDACPKRALLVCGDMAGNVMSFAVPLGILHNHVAGLFTESLSFCWS